MLRNRWTLTGAALAVLACAGFVVLMLLPPEPGVSRANFSRLEIGATKAETEAILGPPGDIASNGRNWCFVMMG